MPCTSVARGLQQVAEAEGALAIIVGLSHSGPLGRIVPGSVSERLLHGAPCPVAVAPRGYWGAGYPRIRRIGVGYVATPEADDALNAAIGLAARTGAAVRVLSVVEPPAVTIVLPFEWNYAELENIAREDLTRRVRRAIDDVDAPVEISDEVVDGYADDELARISRKGRPLGLRLTRPRADRPRHARQRVDRRPAKGALPGPGPLARSPRRLRGPRGPGSCGFPTVIPAPDCAPVRVAAADGRTQLESDHSLRP